MNKVDLQNICTEPPREWLLIDKYTGKKAHYSIPGPIYQDKDCISYIETASGKFYIEIGCYWCAFTGYTDSKGGKVYDRQLVKFVDKIYYIVWRDFQWCIENDTSTIPLCECDPSDMTNIGHIHIKPWPEEVRKLLEE